MVSNARVLAEQAKLAMNDSYVAAHGPANPVRQGVTPESVFSHPGLIREALENPGEEVETINERSFTVSTPLTSVGGEASVNTETNTAEVTSKPKDTSELTDAQKDAVKSVKTVDTGSELAQTAQREKDEAKEAAKANADASKNVTIENASVQVNEKK